MKAVWMMHLWKRNGGAWCGVNRRPFTANFERVTCKSCLKNRAAWLKRQVGKK